MRSAQMRNGNGILRAVIASVLMFVASSLLSAQQPAPPNPLPPGMGQYVMVLWESGTPFPNDPSKTMKVTEPDIASLGGQVISKSANRRVIRLPLKAANGLRHHPSVAYLQRLWMGESFDHWDDGLSETDPPQSSASPSRHKTEDDTNLQWGPKAYSYDGSGNISQIGTDHYVYDSAGRLIEAVVNGKTERYSYDAFGNLTQRVVDGANPVNIPVDGESNRISGVIYDVAGNVLNGGSDGRRTYSYDSLNMMTRIRPFGTDRRYIYDADDEQIGMLYPTGGPVTETSRWTFRDFDGHVIREYNVDQFDNGQGGMWRWEQDSFYGEGMLLGAETQPFYFNFNNTTTTWGGKRHYHLDHLGSVRMVTDDMGRSIDEHDYYPFGTTMTRTYQDQFSWADPHIDAARFAGHRRDFLGSLNVDDTEYLDNMHARYYDPNLGRFLSVDPMMDVKSAIHSPQGWNRYSYVRDNPLIFTDPTGTTVYLVTYTTGNSEGDDEFRRAAETRAAQIQNQEGYDAAKDTVLVRGVKTKDDFAAAIKEANGLENIFGKVGNISLFSHAGTFDGPVFHDATGHSTQFTRAEVDALKVNWAENATASFYGCNTALLFSGMFTRSQGVGTDGFTGYASFSSNPNHYERIQSTGPVYMMTVPPHQLRNIGMTSPWSMTHYTPWPWDGR